MIPLDNKQLRWYRKDGKFELVSVDEAISRGLNKWEGWKCSAGVRSLYIDFDGGVWVPCREPWHVPTMGLDREFPLPNDPLPQFPLPQRDAIQGGPAS